MDAAIGRFDFWFNHSIFYVGLDLLIVLGMLRDWQVDGRVPQGVSLCAAPDDRFAGSCGLCVARRSGVVAGDHARDCGIVKFHLGNQSNSSSSRWL